MSENAKYCCECGSELLGGRVCPKCTSPRSEKIVKAVQSRDRDQWDKWYNREIYKNCPDGINHLSFCHSCKFFMYHPLTYCPTCPGKMVKQKVTLKEMIEKYKDYKEGY